jgi:glycosyltransferase involved in cell wall biosynthesis
MKLFAFHDGSACGFYRILLPFGQLRAHGHQTRAVQGEAVPDGDEDIVVGERMDNPEVLPIWRRFRVRSRLVFEIDDDIWSVDPVNVLAWRTFRQPIPRDVVAHAAQVADLVTVTTPHLAEVVTRETGQRNVAVLPNHIPQEVLQMQRPQRDKVTVGWAGGASHALDLAMIARPLRRFLDRNPHAELHLIGTNYSAAVNGRCRWTDWAPRVFGYYANIDFDIGLAPLHPSPFANSKSHIKALEYAGLGIPTIASDLPPYREFVLDGTTGFLVRREHEWGRRLYELANDPAMRTEMGAKAREHAAGWTIQRGWRQWEAAYASML